MLNERINLNDLIRDKYLNEKKSGRTIATELDIGYTQVYERLKRMGVTRTRQEARGINPQRGFPLGYTPWNTGKKSPRGKKAKKCKTCGNIFYPVESHYDITLYCSGRCREKFNYEKHKERRRNGARLLHRKLKNKVVTKLGGKCEICGYNKSNAALDIHHKNPETKEDRKWKTTMRKIINNEISKSEIMLLCANCHREVHEVRGENNE